MFLSWQHKKRDDGAKKAGFLPLLPNRYINVANAQFACALLRSRGKEQKSYLGN